MKPVAVFKKDKAGSSRASPGHYSSAPNTPTTKRSHPTKSPVRAPSQKSETTGQMDAMATSLKQLEDKLQKLEVAPKLPMKMDDMSRLDADISRLSRDLMSARADSMRTEGRVIKAVEDVGKLSKYD